MEACEATTLPAPSPSLDALEHQITELAANYRPPRHRVPRGAPGVQLPPGAAQRRAPAGQRAPQLALRDLPPRPGRRAGSGGAPAARDGRHRPRGSRRRRRGHVPAPAGRFRGIVCKRRLVHAAGPGGRHRRGPGCPLVGPGYQRDSVLFRPPRRRAHTDGGEPARERRRLTPRRRAESHRRACGCRRARRPHIPRPLGVGERSGARRREHTAPGLRCECGAPPRGTIPRNHAVAPTSRLSIASTNWISTPGPA